VKLCSKKLLAGLLGAITLACGSANATVVTFDKLKGEGAVPAVYRGIAWEDGWYYLSSEFPPFDAHSSPTRIYSDADDKGFSFINGDQVFNGAWFAGFYYVSFELYDDGVLVHSSPTLELFGSGPARFLASGYEGLVDAVRVLGVGGAYVMDDVTYHAEVPEPGMPELMLAGMLAAGALNLGLSRADKRAARVRES
jgi:hypothetical protein